MARLVPSVAGVQLPGTHRGESATLSSLKRLGPAFTVYHGVHWTRTRANGAAFGEIDFVVVNRAGDVLVIEQKNGSLIETGNDLRKEVCGGREERHRATAPQHRPCPRRIPHAQSTEPQACRASAPLP